MKTLTREMTSLLSELRQLGFPAPKSALEALEIYNAHEKALAQEAGQRPLLAKPYKSWYPKRFKRVEKKAVPIFTKVELYFPAL